jgi:hypothetical protein
MNVVSTVSPAEVAQKILVLLRETNAKVGDKLPSERELSRRFGIAYQNGSARRPALPEEVSVIGVNDVSWAAHSSPPLTTIHFDYAYTVGGLLNHALAQSGLASSSEPPKKGLGLVIRKSCGGQETLDLKTLAPILSDACKIPVDIYSMP